MSQLELWRFLMVAHTHSASCITLQYDVALVGYGVKGSSMLALGELALMMLFPSLLVRIIYYAYWESDSKTHGKAKHH